MLTRILGQSTSARTKTTNRSFARIHGRATFAAAPEFRGPPAAGLRRPASGFRLPALGLLSDLDGPSADRALLRGVASGLG